MHNSKEYLDLFACGYCLSPLEVAANMSLRCAKCNRIYPECNGVLSLSDRTDREFQEVTVDMPKFLTDVETLGWDLAFATLLASLPLKDRKFHEQYVTDERRSGWKFWTNLKSDGVAVDFGCGWGANAIGLTSSFRTVLAFDLSITRLQATHHRAQALAINNLITVQAGDTPKLPLANQSVDLFALNGVLEYLALGGQDSPRDCQLEFLKEVHRVLKPDGQVYVGIENRFGWPFFMGSRDHPGTKYTSLMPRWIADRYCRGKIGQPYRWYTYGYHDLQQLIRDAGFAKVDMYAPFPHYSEFTHQFVLNRTDGIAWALQPQSWKRRLAKWVALSTSLFKYFSHCYVAIGSKDPASTSFLDQLVGNLLVPVHSPTQLRTMYLHFSGTNKIAAFLNEEGAQAPSYIALLNVSQDPTNRLESSIRSLQELQSLVTQPPQLQSLLPSIEAEGTQGRHRYLVQRAISGQPASRYIRNGPFREKFLRNAATFIANFGAITSHPQSAESTIIEQITNTYIRNAARSHPQFVTPQVQQKASAIIRETWDGKTLSLVATHGDYCPSHIFIDPVTGEITGVIDWEFLQAQDLPFYDLLTLFIHTECTVTDLTQDLGLQRVIVAISQDTPYRQAALAYIERLQLPTGSVRAVAVAYLFRYLAAMAQHPERRVLPVLENLETTIDYILCTKNLP